MLLLFVRLSLSWWYGGHIIVAEIARRMLTDAQVSYLEELFAQWPSESNFTSIVEFSTWQDELKSSSINIMGTWHYSDKAVIAEGYKPKSLIRSYNITDIISESIDAIMDPTTGNWTLNFALRTLLHFIGDIHQPLHNSAYFSERYPKGDAGGNFIKLQCNYGSPCSNLHSMWDSALLLYQFNDSHDDFEQFEKNVSEILNEFAPEQQSDHPDTMDPAIMNDDAYLVAKEYTYGGFGDAVLAKYDKVPVNDTYMVPNRIQAKRALSLGGYRLGRILQKFFDVRDASAKKKKTMGIGAREIAAWVVDGVIGAAAVVYIVLEVFDARKQRSCGLLGDEEAGP
jgi:hypothetical protein